jgi:hypothetical protein
MEKETVNEKKRTKKEKELTRTKSWRMNKEDMVVIDSTRMSALDDHVI